VQLQSVQSKGIHIFQYWVFVYFVEVIFLIVDLDHAGRVCLHHIAFAWWSLIYFYAEQVISVKFFLNTSESSQRINLFGCTEHVMTCMLITQLSFSERAQKSRNNVLNKNNPSCETTQKQQLWFQPRRLIYCRKIFAFLVSKTSSSKHMTIENLTIYCIPIRLWFLNLWQYRMEHHQYWATFTFTSELHPLFYSPQVVYFTWWKSVTYYWKKTSFHVYVFCFCCM